MIMTQLTRDIHRSRIADQQFLFSGADAADGPPPEDTAPAIAVDELTKKFSGLLVENEFQRAAMDFLETAKTFGTLVIRLDDAHYVINPMDVVAALAGAVDAVCKEASGIWGILDHATLGCFLAGADDTACLDVSRKIKKALAAKCNETVSAGIALYPTLSYAKDKILENAQKALDHAAFFGADSCVAFDSVSLNISGDKLYQAGDLEGAMNEYYLALKLDENDANVHNSLGVCYGIKEDLENALAEFQTAIRLAPEENMAVYNAGYVHFLKKEYPVALEYFQKAEQIDDTVFELAFQTGRIYQELNKLEKAKKYLEKATALNPKSAAAFRLMGDIYTATDHISDAITAYKTALKLNPEDAESLSALGFLYEMQGKNADIALMFCCQGTEMAPGNGLFRQRLGRLYLNRNLTEKALAEFEKARELGYDADDYIDKTRALINTIQADARPN